MAPKNLNPEEMSQISEGWVDPQKEAHQAILSIPMLNAQLPLIVSAHKGIQDILTPAQDPRIANIITIELAKDRRHDTIIRGSWDMLTAMADLIGGDVGASLIALRDLLIPAGLPSMLKSYRAESTQAKELRKAMTPEVRKRTDAIRIGEGTATLTDYLEEWIGLGVDLGDLEDEKGKLLASTSSDVTAAMILAARNQWIRVVNAMVSNAEMVAISDAHRALIFGPLIDAEGKADIRARGGSKPRAKTEEELAAEAKAAAEKAAAEKAAEKAAIEKAAAEKAAAEKAAADKAAADKATADKAAAEKAPKGPTS